MPTRKQLSEVTKIIDQIKTRNIARNADNLIRIDGEKDVPYLNYRSDFLSASTLDIVNCGFCIHSFGPRVKEKELWETPGMQLPSFYLGRTPTNTMKDENGVSCLLLHHDYERFQNFVFDTSDCYYDPMYGYLKNIEEVQRLMLQKWPKIKDYSIVKAIERKAKKKLKSGERLKDIVYLETPSVPGAVNVRYIEPYVSFESFKVQSLTHPYELIFRLGQTIKNPKPDEYARHLIFERAIIEGVYYYVINLNSDEMDSLCLDLILCPDGVRTYCKMKQKSKIEKYSDKYKGNCDGRYFKPSSKS